MPCSRSARRPSVSSARSVYSSPRRRLVSSTCSSWSANTCFESNKRRPIRVLLPSSTEPAVAMRSVLARRSTTGSGCPLPSMTVSLVVTGSLEVTGALAVLHGRLAHTVVGAGLAALGDARGRDLLHHRLEGDRPRLHRAGARHVAHGSVAHARLERLLAIDQLDERAERVEHPVAAEHLALVREVD